VVVRAPGQELPELPAGIELVDDAREGRGPLQGLAAGLGALQGRAGVAYASATDVPLLHPRFVERVLAALDDDVDVALPVLGGFPHPLAAAYRVELAAAAERFLAADRMRLTEFVGTCRVRELRAPELPAALDSVRNINTRADYEAARARPVPEVTVTGVGLVRAASLGATGVALPASINGEPLTADPQAPLVAGDTVAPA
jgi:molybdopterin-guanine dinucleotide biosynthesis protein A